MVHEVGYVAQGRTKSDIFIAGKITKVATKDQDLSRGKTRHASVQVAYEYRHVSLVDAAICFDDMVSSREGKQSYILPCWLELNVGL